MQVSAHPYSLLTNHISHANHVIQKLMMLAVLLLCNGAFGTAAIAESWWPWSNDEEKSYEVYLEDNIAVATVTNTLDKPWQFTFLCNGDMLITEKEGALIKLGLSKVDLTQLEPNPTQKEDTTSNPKLSIPQTTIIGTPKVMSRGQGSLGSVVVAQPCSDIARGNINDTNELPWLFLSYSVTLDNGKHTTQLMRAQLSDRQLINQQVLFTAEPALDGRGHFGSALASDGQYIYLTVGDHQQRRYAQDLTSHLGSVIRLHHDGRVPTDNPFVDNPDARDEIWSYGHRNPQGLTIHPVTGELWAAEHGPRGGDEVNIIRKGQNYGWPIITYGREYSGGNIGPGYITEHNPPLLQPEYHYTPSIAPAGMDFYHANTAAPHYYAGWQNNLFVAALKLTHINQLSFRQASRPASTTTYDKTIAETRLLEQKDERVRAVHPGPDGALYAITDSGKLLKITSLSK